MGGEALFWFKDKTWEVIFKYLPFTKNNKQPANILLFYFGKKRL